MRTQRRTIAKALLALGTAIFGYDVAVDGSINGARRPRKTGSGRRRDGVRRPVPVSRSRRSRPRRRGCVAVARGNGDEALFLRRHFETSRPRDFVDTLRWNPARGCITDLFGRNGRVAADLHLCVDDGDLALTLGAQWLRVGGRYVPLRGPLAVTADRRDRYDDDAEEFRVDAEISNPLIGCVFAYEGASRRPPRSSPR